MKTLLTILFIIFLSSPTSPLTAVYDEEKGEEIPTLSYGKKFRRLLGNLGKETAHWAGNHKKTVAFSTLTLFALATMYHTLIMSDESLFNYSPIDPCTFNNDGIFDIHACAHYLESSVNTSTLNLFLASAQEKFADAWENVPDSETLKNSLLQVWEALQSHHCHIHDEL
jgi:hypothetical protein